MDEQNSQDNLSTNTNTLQPPVPDINSDATVNQTVVSEPDKLTNSGQPDSPQSAELPASVQSNQPVQLNQSSSPFGPPQVANTASPEISQAAAKIQQIRATYSNHIIGQEEMLESILVCLISNGHLLIEGVPGLAKTTAAHTIASTIGADFARIQCTPDMLPSDIVGTQIYNQQQHEFTTQLGPINHQFILVDEVNRTSAKTQSALLEAMQERQVSIGGETYKLPEGFIVLATQNPIEQEGTYPLPEAQLDRFMLKHVMTYPTLEQEVNVMKLPPLDQSTIKPTANIKDILELQEVARKIAVDDRVLQYVASITDATRFPEKYGLADLRPMIEIGASPRASLSLIAAARARALITQSSYVTPDHIKPFLDRVFRHRIGLTYEAEAENIRVEDVIQKIGSVVPVP